MRQRGEPPGQAGAGADLGELGIVVTGVSARDADTDPALLFSIDAEGII